MATTTMTRTMSDYRFASYSRVTNARAADLEIYGWCLFVEADAATLRQIDAVEYTLHPTFENPVRRITDPANCFMMETTGWGGFRIAIRVFVKGPSSSPLDMSFMLDLSPDGWATRATPGPDGHPRGGEGVRKTVPSKIRVEDSANDCEGRRSE